uniref:Uncharacterized protein n=1 Tax=Oryza brachyantha TaxID=4533 RepID=J3LBF1_ORYBR
MAYFHRCKQLFIILLLLIQWFLVLRIHRNIVPTFLTPRTTIFFPWKKLIPFDIGMTGTRVRTTDYCLLHLVPNFILINGQIEHLPAF